MEMFVDEDVTGDEHITFNAGTHYQAIRMRYADYARITNPRVFSFGVPASLHSKKGPGLKQAG